MVDDLLKLIERVEKATGPDRELDAAIARAIDAEPVGLARVTFPRDPADERFLRYTASLDAAMSLVPEGWKFGCGSKDATCRAWAWVGAGADPLDRAEHIASGATPALALTAAALRSIASLRSEGEK